MHAEHINTSTMKIILTGATGYVGEGVLLELLRSSAVEKVLSVSRRPTGILQNQYNCLTSEQTAKLEEYIVPDMLTLKKGDKHFDGYDAVFFIAGVTSIGTPVDIYDRISYDIPVHFADIMPDKDRMTFIYLSGAGTTPNGKQHWQQVKSRTESETQAMGFKHAFAYRPALMRWAKGQKRMQAMQYAFICFYPLTYLLRGANSMTEVALSMLVCARDGYHKQNIDPIDIQRLAKKL